MPGERGAREAHPKPRVFVVHHNPNNGRYRYPANPTDALESARALLKEGESDWVAGNCRRLIHRGDLLLFKFGGGRLRQEPGIYAAARVTEALAQGRSGVWRLQYRPDARMTRRLNRAPIIGKALDGAHSLPAPAGRGDLGQAGEKCGSANPSGRRRGSGR